MLAVSIFSQAILMQCCRIDLFELIGIPKKLALEGMCVDPLYPMENPHHECELTGWI
jgi:hypothetical protein